MRRGEILGLRWDHIDERRQSAYLPITKNGRSRHVPLNTTTIEFIRKIPRDAEKLFPISDTACRQAWDRLRNRAGILDLTFHDLRHEAVSRMFEKGINMARVMAISGHRTPNQMFRYVQVDSI